MYQGNVAMNGLELVQIKCIEAVFYFRYTYNVMVKYMSMDESESNHLFSTFRVDEFIVSDIQIAESKFKADIFHGRESNHRITNVSITKTEVSSSLAKIRGGYLSVEGFQTASSTYRKNFLDLQSANASIYNVKIYESSTKGGVIFSMEADFLDIENFNISKSTIVKNAIETDRKYRALTSKRQLF